MTTQGGEKNMIIAILKAGQLSGKIKLPQHQREIDILLPLPLGLGLTEHLNPTNPSNTPRLRFIWRRQVSNHKHEYVLKEIL